MSLNFKFKAGGAFSIRVSTTLFYAIASFGKLIPYYMNNSVLTCELKFCAASTLSVFSF